MSIDETLLEVHDYTLAGFRPVIDYGAWRVAILNSSEELLPENLSQMERHHETDEVFVLLRGRCILFLGAGDETITQIYAEEMRPFKIYNVKKAAWHTHTLSEEAMVLVVENRDTTTANSAYGALTEAQRQTIVDLTRAWWNDND